MAINIPEIPGLVNELEKTRDKYPTPLGNKHAACLIDLALTARKFAQTLPNNNPYKSWLHKTGLLKKTSGTRITLLSVPGHTGVQVSQDVFAYPTSDTEHYDILKDGEGEAKVHWGEQFNYLTTNRYVDIAPWIGGVIVTPDEPNEPNEPDEPDIPPPTNDDTIPQQLDRIELALRRIESRVQELQADFDSGIKIEADEFPSYEGRQSGFLGGAINLNPVEKKKD